MKNIFSYKHYTVLQCMKILKELEKIGAVRCERKFTIGCTGYFAYWMMKMIYKPIPDDQVEECTHSLQDFWGITPNPDFKED